MATRTGKVRRRGGGGIGAPTFENFDDLDLAPVPEVDADDDEPTQRLRRRPRPDRGGTQRPGAGH